MEFYEEWLASVFHKFYLVNLEYFASFDRYLDFRSGQAYSEGAYLLKDQMNIVNNDYIVNCNLFEITDSDMDEANAEKNIFDESDDENDFIEIE